MKKKSALYSILIASLIIHSALIFFVTFDTTPLSFKAAQNNYERKIKVVIKQDLSRLLKNKRQIVNTKIIKQKKLKERPRTRFLGKITQKVNKQTRAKRVGSFSQGQKGSHQKSKAQTISFKDLSFNKDSNVVKNMKPMRNQMGTGGYNRPAASNDFLPDVKVGQMTLLSTSGFKYYGFYNRVKDKIEGRWINKIKNVSQARSLAGPKYQEIYVRPTSLVVTLDPKGNILSIRVASSSGLEEFDQAAIESFSGADPFHNPPRSMIKNGKIRLVWGFVVQS